MKLLLLNRDERLLQKITDYSSLKGTKVINGIDTLEMTTYDLPVEKNHRVLMEVEGEWSEWIVHEVEESHTESGFKQVVYLESSFYELIGDFILDKRFNNLSALNALMGVLEETRWQVGKVDSLGQASYSPYRINAKEAVQTIATTWGGEMQTRIDVVGNKVVNRYIDILAKVGTNTGKRFTWTKDIQSIQRTILRDDVYTALYGFGKGEEVGEGYSRRIDFSEINDGKAYVENLDALERYGRNNADGSKSHVFGKIEYDDVTDKEELKRLATEDLEELTQPALSYEASVINLKHFGYEHEGYELGDEVLIIDKEFKPELRILARIIEKETDYLDEMNSKVTLGNFRSTLSDDQLKNESVLDNFRDKSGVWDRANYITPEGNIWLDNILEQINTMANITGGYVYMEEGEGLVTYDKPIDQNPTMAVQVLGGLIRIASEKNPDGSWNWRTALTGKGIVADEINTGKLSASLIQAGWNDIAFGTTITEDGVKSVDATGEYAILEKGGVGFYTIDDIKTGSIETVYSAGNTGPSIVVPKNMHHSIIRNNDGYLEALYGIPIDDDRFTLFKDANANHQGIVGASRYTIVGPNSDDMAGIFAGSSNDMLYVQGWGGVVLGDRRPENDGSLLGDAIFTRNGHTFYRSLSMNGNDINNINAIGFINGAGRIFSASDGNIALDTNAKISLQGSETISHSNLNMNGHTVINQSDSRLKDKIEDTKVDAIKETKRLRMVDFEWKKDHPATVDRPRGQQFGMIAQETAFLQTKSADSDSYLSIDINKQINLSTLTNQELIAQNERQEERIETLETELNDLKQLLVDKGVI